MGATDLTALVSISARQQAHMPASGRVAGRQRPVAVAAALVICVTLAGVALGLVRPAIAPGPAPHPTLHGTVVEAADILVHNLRVLALPFVLLLVFGRAGRGARLCGDALLGASLAVNCVPVGLALARWQSRLLPYLPHLPLEWSALAVASSVWIAARTGDVDSQTPRRLARVALPVLVLAAAAAAVETFGTPHRTTGHERATGHVGGVLTGRFHQGLAVGCLRRDFAPRPASRCKVAALPSPHFVRLRSAGPAALTGFINHHEPQGGLTP